MKPIIIKTIAAGIITFNMLLAGCTKEGPVGPQGAVGANGTNGQNGTNGVANITSTIYTVTPGSWVITNPGYYNITIADTSIKNANTNGIEVFAGPGNGTWFGLPASNLIATGDNLNYSYNNGQVELIYTSSFIPSISIQLKVVVIPPAHKKLNINPKNYLEAKAANGLKD